MVIVKIVLSEEDKALTGNVSTLVWIWGRWNAGVENAGVEKAGAHFIQSEE